MARYNREIVGTCALIKTDDTYELAKMAVERARGKNIGWLLGQAVNVARKLGAKKVFGE